MSNEAKMSLEDKLVQNLKEERLYALLGDEDALLELVKRALHEALYQPVRERRQYGGYDERDSVVVSTAREVGKKAAAKLVETLVADMLADPAIKKAAWEAIAANLPDAIRGMTFGAFQSFQTSCANEAFGRVQDAIRNKVIV